MPTYKGSYAESMTAAIAAYRAGNAPHILQVFEVGTATMMAAKGAVKPVAKVMTDARRQVRPERLHPRRGRLLHGAQRPDAELSRSTAPRTVFYYNKDAFKAAGLDPEKAAHDLARGGARRGQAEGQRPQVPVHHQLDQLDPAGELLDLAQRAVRHAEQRLRRPVTRLAFNSPAARAPHREPGQHGQAGPVRLQGPRQQARRRLRRPANAR